MEDRSAEPTPIMLQAAISPVLLAPLAKLASMSKSLRERIRLLEAVIENFPGGISLFDSELQMVLCNEQQKTAARLSRRTSSPTAFRRWKDCSASTPCAANTAPATSRSMLPGACGWCASVRRMSTSARGRTAPCRGPRHAARRRRLRHHLSRRHRTAPHPGADRPHGASRHADQPAEPRAVRRSAANGDRARQAVRPVGAALSQHRQVQADQRHATATRPATRC